MRGSLRAVSRWFSFSLILLIVLAPFFMGGRHPLGRLVYAIISWCVILAWFLGRALRRKAKWEWGYCELFVAGVIAVALLQLTPLPAGIRHVVSPTLESLLPVWTNPEFSRHASSGWTTVSVAPEQTRQSICLLLSQGLLFLVAFQRMRRLDHIEWFLKWIAIGTVVMALLGLVQYAFGNGRFLWVYEHPTRSTLYTVKGPFANQNHFAHLLAIGLGPLVWFRFYYIREKQVSPRRRGFDRAAILKHTLDASIAIVLLAGILTFSRGGWIIISLVSVVTLAASPVLRNLDKRTIAVLTGLLLVAAVFVGTHGHDRFQSRMGMLATTSIEDLDATGARRKIWRAVTKAIPDYYRFGAGLGAHRSVYPTYMDEWSDVKYSHAESGYLQVLLELGVPGFTLLLIGLGATAYAAWQAFASAGTLRTKACASALLPCYVATVIHSLFDFVWYIPACSTITLLQFAALHRLRKLADHQCSDDRATQWQLPPLHWRLVAAMSVLIAFGCLKTQSKPAMAAKHWDAYLASSLSLKTQSRDEVPTSDWHLEDRFSIPQLAGMSTHLSHLLASDPNNAQAHLRLATNCLRDFEIQQTRSETPMGLAAIREASLASHFSNAKEQRDWLRRATGERLQLLDRALYHLHRAVSLSPMHGKAYLLLADLAFLQGEGQLRASLLEQALIARPYDGSVLYAVGTEQLSRGDWQSAQQKYKRAFRLDPDLQDTIIAHLASLVSPDAFVAMFEPDERALERLYTYYRENQQHEAARKVGGLYVAELQQRVSDMTSADAAKVWDRIGEVWGELRQLPEALHAAQNSVRANPSSYRARYILGARFEQSGRVDEAVNEFRWCQRRRPGDEAVRAKIEALTRIEIR